MSHVVQAFFYDWIDRTASKNGKPLPEKVGSLQYFMHGFTGTTATMFCSILVTIVLQMHQTFCASIHCRAGQFTTRLMIQTTGKAPY